VPGIESIILTFRRFWKTGKSAKLSYGVKPVFSSGDNLMNIALMTYIPYNFILRSVKHPVKRKGQLYDSQVGSKMPACFETFSIRKDLISPASCFNCSKFSFFISSGKLILSNTDSTLVSSLFQTVSFLFCLFLFLFVLRSSLFDRFV